MERYKEQDELEKIENEHIINLWQPLEFKIDKEYEYIVKNKIFMFFSNLLYYGIAFPVLKILNKLVYDLKIEGKENLKDLKTGAISVSNHVLFLDCSMVGLAWGIKRVYYTTLEGSFKIPFVRRLIKLLRAIPIPNDIKNKEYFIKAIDNLLQNNGIVHFYPESALWPYCEKLRNFKNGAFDFSVKNNVPIIPMVIKFRQPKGIRKLIKSKKDVTLFILKPIKCEENEMNVRDKVNKLKEEVYEQMKKVKDID